MGPRPGRGAQLGAPAVWVLPAAFPVVIGCGAMFGLVGVPLPGVEVALVHRWPLGRRALQAAGGAVAASGIVFLMRAL